MLGYREPHDIPYALGDALNEIVSGTVLNRANAKKSYTTGKVLILRPETAFLLLLKLVW